MMRLLPAAIRLAIVVALSVLAGTSPVHGQILAQVYVTPPKVDNKPVEVQIGFYLDEVPAIDEGANTFDVIGLILLEWSDARLAFDGADGTSRTYLETDATTRLDQIWWPDIQFVNQVRNRERGNEELVVTADGHVRYLERFRVSLSSRFDMRPFPFDSQRLVMDVASFAWSSEDTVFRVRKDIVGFSTEFYLPGWEVLAVEETIQERMMPQDRASFSDLQTIITVRRDPGFFVWKFLVPLGAVMLLITGVLWMPPDLIKDRVSATLTGLLTSSAYGFTITRYLPDHVYDTYLDAVILLSLVFASALMVVNVAVYRLHLNDRRPLAVRIDETARWLFPVGFLVSATLLAVWHQV